MSKTTRVKMKDRGEIKRGLATVTTVFTRNENHTTLRIEDGLRTEVEMIITRDFALQLVGALTSHFVFLPREISGEMKEQGSLNDMP